MTHAEKLPLATMLRRQSRRIFCATLGVIVGLFLTLEGFMVAHEQTLMAQYVSAWVAVNQPLLEQSIFLENALSMREHLTTAYRQLPANAAVRISVFDRDGAPMFGELHQIPHQLPRYFSHNWLHTQLYYFDTLTFAGQRVGDIVIAHESALTPLATKSLAVLLICALLFMIFRRLLRAQLRTVDAMVIQPIFTLRCSMQTTRIDGPPVLCTMDAPTLEVAQFIAGYNELVTQVVQYAAREKNMAELAAVGKIARQVAHDIRSPLTSIQVASRMLHTTAANADVVNLLQLGCRRLEQIANELLTRDGAADGREARSVRANDVSCDVHAMCTALIAEFQSQPLGVGIAFVQNFHTQALVAKIDPVRLQRAISNLMKNALEALQSHVVRAASGDAPLQQLTLATTPIDINTMTLRITDTGPGMSAELIAKMLRGGHTEGKVDGHGIGMQVVQESIVACGGTLHCESAIGRGTTFTVTLPVVDSVSAIPVLQIPYDGTTPIVIIDDEPSMRAQWELLFKEMHVACHSFDSWEAYDAARMTHAVPTTAIVDYHYDNSTLDGITVIERLRALGVQHCILCTAEYWKPSIRDAAAALQITLCSKPLPPMQVQRTSAGRRVLLIDDDTNIRRTWDLVRDSLGIAKLTSFASMEACVAAPPEYATYDCAFVDKHMPKSAWRIDQIIAHLKAAGVKRVYVASGYQAQQLAADPACAGADGIIHEKIPRVLPE